MPRTSRNGPAGSAGAKSPQKTASGLVGWLQAPVDNHPLVLFRIGLGFLWAYHCIHAVAAGLVKQHYDDPAVTFTIPGFSWLQPPPPPWTEIGFLAMGACGFLIAFGAFYRTACAVFGVLWGFAYVLQTTHYNNHYWMMVVMSVLLLVVPAQRGLSWDARRHPELRGETAPRWCLLVIALQMSLVYTFGAIAKLDADWLAGKPLGIWMSNRVNHPWLGWLYGAPWLVPFLAWGGMFFDLLVTPALIWRRTRWIAIAGLLLFHGFNSITFGIGIFPFMSFAFVLFFVDPVKLRRRLPLGRPPALDTPLPAAAPIRRERLRLAFLTLLFLIQFLLPFRHWLYPGPVHWTEEGHMMSWHMMLRTKRTGGLAIMEKNKRTGRHRMIRLQDHLTRHQIARMSCVPYRLWQFAQYLNDESLERGDGPVEVRVNAKCSLNGRPPALIVDPSVDLVAADFPLIGHAPWILISPDR